MTQLIPLLSIVIFSACAGIGIPNSSNPYKKIHYSYGAMDMGRHIPAKRLIEEAIVIFKETKDSAGLAEAYFTFGNYYKFDFTFATLAKPSEPLNAIKYFDLAIKQYEENGNKNGMAKSYMGKGSAFGIDGQLNETCKAYEKAQSLYDPNGENFQILNPNFKTFPEMINAFYKAHCSKVH